MKFFTLCVTAMALVLVESRDCYECIAQSKVYAISLDGDILCERRALLKGIKTQYTATSARACASIQQPRAPSTGTFLPGLVTSESVPASTDAYATPTVVPTKPNPVDSDAIKTLDVSRMPTLAVVHVDPTEKVLPPVINETQPIDSGAAEDSLILLNEVLQNRTTAVDENEPTMNFDAFKMGTLTRREERAFRAICRMTLLVDRLAGRRKFRGIIIVKGVIRWNYRSIARNHPQFCSEIMLAHKLSKLRG